MKECPRKKQIVGKKIFKRGKVQQKEKMKERGRVGKEGVGSLKENIIGKFTIRHTVIKKIWHVHFILKKIICKLCNKYTSDLQFNN